MMALWVIYTQNPKHVYHSDLTKSKDTKLQLRCDLNTNKDIINMFDKHSDLNQPTIHLLPDNRCCLRVNFRERFGRKVSKILQQTL